MIPEPEKPVDEPNWHGLHEAAEALGIDVDTLPTAEAFESRRAVEQPEPEPDVSIHPLTAEQLKVLATALPPSQKHLSRMPMDEFLNGCLWGAASGFKWSIMPRGGWTLPCFTSRWKRWCLGGNFAALYAAVEASPAVFDERLCSLFRALANRERAYQRQVADFQKARRLKLAQSESFTRSRGIQDQNREM